jgi:hypothetical protein
MFVTSRKLVAAVALAVVAGMVARPALADKPEDKAARRGRAPERGQQPREVRGVLAAVDAGKNTLTVAIPSATRREPEEKTFSLAKEAEVLLFRGRGSRFALKEGKLADLHPGAVVTITLAADGKAVESLVAEGPGLQGAVKAVDAARNTLTLTLAPKGRGEDAEEKTFSVSKEAEVALDDGRGRRFSVKEGKLADVPAGSLAMIQLSVDQKTVEGLTATGPNVFGVVKSVDPAANALTLTLGRGRGEEAQEKTFTLAKDADLLLDADGRGRAFAKAGKLADLPAGALAFLKLSLDQKTAVLLRAEGPTAYGTLKAVDVGKGTLTVLVGAGRGSEGEEKTFPLGKKAKAFHDGREIKFAELKTKVKDGTLLRVQLSLDQKTVKSVAVPRE